jgi:hypothetical protein
LNYVLVFTLAILANQGESANNGDVSDEKFTPTTPEAI